MANWIASVEVRNALAVVAVSAIAYQIFTKLLWKGLWTPLRLRRIMAKQGVQGPPFRFLFGQVREYMAYRDSFPEVVPLNSYADFSPTVTPQYALFFPKFPGTNYLEHTHSKATKNLGLVSLKLEFFDTPTKPSFQPMQT